MTLVLTVDQRGSRQAADLVPAMLERLAVVPLARPFQRTVGDEFQGVAEDPASVALALEPLLRDGHWHIGLGFGAVDRPLPAQAREGRGAAFVHARAAVTAAKQAPWPVRVVGGDGYRAEQLETSLWLWAGLLSRRTDKGWEVVDLVEQGLGHQRVAERLRITPSAVSQRLRVAGQAEGVRARTLVTHLAAACLETP
jgi:hypothetical protein